MVNWEHVEAVLSEIELDRTKFWMYEWERVNGDCTTTRCLAGWATEMARRSGLPLKGVGHLMTTDYIITAADYLGLPAPDFSPDNAGHAYGGYENLFSPAAYNTSRPSTHEIRARLKEYDHD